MNPLTGNIAVIVPSRGRPENIERLLTAWVETATKAELHVVVDDDDCSLEDYQLTLHPQRMEALFRSVPTLSRPTLWVGPRRRLGGSLNHLAPHLAKYVDVVGFMGDDHVPRTLAWDSLCYSASSLDSVVYGNDLIQGAALPTAVFMGARIVQTLGWFVVPGMTHLFMDNLWKTIGEQLGTLRYLPDVVIEHVHPIAGKAEWDDGYAQANSSEVWDHDEAIYKEWVAFQMPTDIAKIKAAR